MIGFSFVDTEKCGGFGFPGFPGLCDLNYHTDRWYLGRGLEQKNCKKETQAE